MRSLIKEYEKSCLLVQQRIKLLTAQRNELIKSGRTKTAENLKLEQRIRILYAEYAQMREIISHLESYAGSVEKRGKT